jgi:hypothetical protein
MSDANTEQSIDCGNEIYWRALPTAKVESGAGRIAITPPDAAYRVVVTRHPVKGPLDSDAEAAKVFKTFATRQSNAELVTDTFQQSGHGYVATLREYRIPAVGAAAPHRVCLAVLARDDAAFSVVVTARETSGVATQLVQLVAARLSVGGPLSGLEPPPASVDRFAPLDFSLPDSLPVAQTPVKPQASVDSDLPTLTFESIPVPPPPQSDATLPTLTLPAQVPRGPLKLQTVLPKLTPTLIEPHGVELLAPADWTAIANGLQSPDGQIAFSVVQSLVMRHAPPPVADLESVLEFSLENVFRLQTVGSQYVVKAPAGDIHVIECDAWEPDQEQPNRLYVMSWYAVTNHPAAHLPNGELCYLQFGAWLRLAPRAQAEYGEMYRKLLEGINTLTEKNVPFLITLGLQAQPPAGVQVAAVPADGYAPAEEIYAPNPRPRLKPFEIDDVGVDVTVPASFKKQQGNDAMVGDDKTGAHVYVASVAEPLGSASLERWTQFQQQQLTSSARAPQKIGPTWRVRRPTHQATLMEFEYEQPDTGLPYKLFAYCACNQQAPDSAEGTKQQFNVVIVWRIPRDEFDNNEGMYRWLIQTQTSLRLPKEKSAVPEEATIAAPEAKGAGTANLTNQLVAQERGLKLAFFWELGAIVTFVLALVFYAGADWTYPEWVIAAIAVGLSIQGARVYAKVREWPTWKLVLTIIGLVIPVVNIILVFTLYARIDKRRKGEADDDE